MTHSFGVCSPVMSTSGAPYWRDRLEHAILLASEAEANLRPWSDLACYLNEWAWADAKGRVVVTAS